MFVHRVSANAHGAVLSHILPEVLCSHSIVGHSRILFADSFKANILGHLRVGMLAVEEGGVERLHAVEHGFVRELLGSLQIFLLAEELVGIEQALVHATVFGVEHGFHVGRREFGYHVHAPVGKLAKHLFGCLVLAIDPCIAQAGEYLVLTIEGHPTALALKLAERSAVECCPHIVDGLSANETIESLGVGIVSILTVFHHTHHIVHALLHLRLHGSIVVGCVCQGKCRKIVTTHMTVEIEAVVAPVHKRGVQLGVVVILVTGIGGGGESGLAHIGREQAVHIVLQEHLVVQEHRPLQGRVEQGNLAQFEMTGIEF